MVRWWSDWKNFRYIAAAVLLGELILGVLIIERVAYTEIDWKAYMQEVEGYLQGERDYQQLRGDTGPLVYPAGFVYVYSALHWLSDGGSAVRRIQYVFLGLYLVMQALTFAMYARTRPGPPWAIVVLALSKRIHSIFMLRLFNDGVAMVLAHAAILLFSYYQWALGCLVFSLAVSVKMNVLLFAPALLLLLWRNTGFVRTVQHLAICAGVQVLLGWPFLSTYPVSYLTKAFELSRVFQYKWTVNWKFLSEETFVSRTVAVGLLSLHLFLLAIFLLRWFGWSKAGWLQAGRCALVPAESYPEDKSTADPPTTTSPTETERQGTTLRRRRHHQDDSTPAALPSEGPPAELEKSIQARDPPLVIAVVLFTSNFIGVVCARTLHYQFYVWYFHSLLWLGNAAAIHGWEAALIFLGIEWAFNVFPATAWSSAVIQVAHALLLFGLFMARPAASVWEDCLRLGETRQEQKA